MSPGARFGIAAAAVVVAILGLIGFSLTGATAYYLTPGELTSRPVEPGQRVRVAGRVVEGSIGHKGSMTNFAVTDGRTQVAVTTDDVLPDTFGPGVEVVAEGGMTAGRVFAASNVLAKCPSKFKAKLPAARPAE